jgi:hypothetical protein
MTAIRREAKYVARIGREIKKNFYLVLLIKVPEAMGSSRPA